jgi:serine/threonine protein kinase/tetratricopeptide (TPR) repeat protein/TolB-like protein
MPVRDWERIKAAFETSKDAPEDELDDILSSLCADDPSMAAFVRSLIRNSRDGSAPGEAHRGRAFADGDLVSGRLRIVRFIAAGAMGEVYEAYDERLRLRLAMKTVRPELTQAADALSRFEREIRMAREVTHANLCRVFDFIEHIPSRSEEGSLAIPCYTMELIEGESLAEYLALHRPLSPHLALSLLRQVAAGLDALHERGIVHRDLKPSNIMLARNDDRDPRVVLTDFGLAKLVDGRDEMFQTLVDVQAGAPYFMAPEVLRNHSLSCASDIYAFGLIADEMVTRSRAFSAESLQALYFAKLWEAPIPPSERSHGLPPVWQDAIFRCLSLEPEDRFARAGDMILALEGATAVAVIAQRPAPLPPWSKNREARAFKRLRRNLLVLATAGVAALVLSVFLILGARASEPVSVQVYDIVNATGNPNLDYLCKGASGELIRRLSQLQRIHVLPMHTIRNGSPDKNGRIVVEGMLLDTTGHAHLNLMLIDNQTGETFSTEKFDQAGDDSLQMENDLAARMVRRIQEHLVAAIPQDRVLLGSLLPLIWRLKFGFSSDKPASGPTTNSHAFDLYMRGRQLMDEYSQPTLEAAISYLRGATEQDPSFALGFATLAEAQLNMMTFMRTPQQDSLLGARRNAETAVRLDPSLAEAQAAQAYVLQAEWDWGGAAVHFQNALRIKPVYPAARRRYAGLLLQFGKIAEAIPMVEQAFAEDPYDRGSVAGIGLYYFLAGRYQDSIRFLETQIGENDMQVARHNLGDSLAEAALTAPPETRRIFFERALAQAARVSSIEQKVFHAAPMGDEMFAHYYILMQDFSAAAPYFERVQMQLQQGLASPAIVAWLYALRGERGRALDLLEDALSQRDRRLMYVKLFPALRSLHGEPRFEALITKMKL